MPEAARPTDVPDETPDWHAIEPASAMSALQASPAGLSTEAAAERLASHGPNRLPEGKRRGPLLRFLSQFDNLLIYVLLGAAVITALLGHWVDTWVILAVVLLNAVIGFVQEGKAERALESIRDMLAPKAAVIRGGRRLTVAGDALVPGDVVLIESGDRVPADLRLFETHGLSIQEAVLTGESVAVEKSVAPVAAHAALGDRTSMAYSGTLVAAGQGRGLVVATGAHTEIGRISGLLSEVERLTTPLLRAMDQFARRLAGAVLAVSAAILAYGVLVRGYGFAEIFMGVVAVAVAAIPEGLPTILTVTLAIGVQGMARRNAIVRRLPAIETLGSVSVICSDKTGTLTRNEMTVASIAVGSRDYRVSGVGYEPHGGFSVDGGDVEPAADPLLVEIVRAGLLCSDATVEHREDGARVEGDPMEGALVVAAMKAEQDPEQVRGSHPRTDTIPFDAQHRFMATLHHDHEGHGWICVKGAPERVLQMCARQRGEAGDVALAVDEWTRRAHAIAEQGQRVIAVAAREASAEQRELRFSDVEADLTLLGLFGLIDPPRDEAIAAVADCRSAGIRVKMITGDHAGTAAAIARELGLEGAGQVVTGADVDTLDEDALRERALCADVFARTSPEHKLRLVQALQAEGEVVAMTGDGVNDAPALKRADVGIAMGRKGSEAAKEAAEMVLADDNFATIAHAVGAGRAVYDNLKKAIMFLLPVNGGESMCLVAALLAGMTLPITPVQVLWVNMVSSVALAMALAFEPPEPDVMRRPPRPAGEPILSRFLLWRIGLVSLLFALGVFGMFELAIRRGESVETARTVAVNTLVVMEVFYLFSVRFLAGPSVTLRGAMGTPAVLLAVGGVTALQMLFTYAPFMATFFETRALSIVWGVQIVAVGVALMLLLEAEKALLRRLRGVAPGGRRPGPQARRQGRSGP